MFNRGRRAWIERDSRGRERFVMSRSASHHRSSSHHGRARSLDNDAEAREDALTAEIRSLQTRLSVAQRDQWHLQQLRAEHQRIVNEHYGCRHSQEQLEAQARELRRMERLLADEQDRAEKLMHKNERLEEKVRLIKRGSREEDGLREAYEQRTLEVEMLRQRLIERDNEVRLAETRIVEKNNTILYLKNFLRREGFRVE